MTGCEQSSRPPTWTRQTARTRCACYCATAAPGDADLLRHLLILETAEHREGWGLSESMGLAAVLLAECGREEDVWALWEAKNASFDTMAGLDGFLLFPAGIAGTTAHVIASDHAERNDVMVFMSEYLEYEKLTDDDIRERLASLRSYYEG